MRLKKVKKFLQHKLEDIYKFESEYYDVNKGVVFADYMQMLRQRRHVVAKVAPVAVLWAMGTSRGATGWHKAGKLSLGLSLVQLAVYADCYIEAAKLEGSTFQRMGDVYLRDHDEVEVEYKIENPLATMPWIPGCKTCNSQKFLWYERPTEEAAIKLAVVHQYEDHGVILVSDEEMQISDEDIDTAVRDAVGRLSEEDRALFDQRHGTGLGWPDPARVPDSTNI